MISKYLRIITGFSEKGYCKLDRERILSKSNELDANFPEPMIEFYEFFGNNEEVLNAYYEFENIENIIIQNSGLVFGHTHQHVNLLGIKLEELSNKDPKINRFEKELNHWYAESVFSSGFFTNIACWQVLNTMPSIAKIKISEKELFKKVDGKLYPISEEKIIFKGYDLYSYFNVELGILACYLRQLEEFYIASKNDEIIEKFESDMNWDLDWL